MSTEKDNQKNTSEKKLTPEEENKKKIEALKKSLGITRVNEDISELRAQMEKTNEGVVELIQTIKAAQGQGQQQTQNTSQDSSEILSDLPYEQKMLMIKETMGGIADVLKAWKGQPQTQAAQGDYGSTIMSSLARAFQVHVDDIVYGTLTRLPPEARQQYTQGFVPPPPAQPVPIQKAGFDKG